MNGWAVSGRGRWRWWKEKKGLSRWWSLGQMTHWEPKPTSLGLHAPSMPSSHKCISLHKLFNSLLLSPYISIALSLHLSVSPLRHDANESWRRKEAVVSCLKARNKTKTDLSLCLRLILSTNAALCSTRAAKYSGGHASLNCSRPWFHNSDL